MRTTTLPRELLPVVAGPMLAGAILGVQTGLIAVLEGSLLLPAIFLGVTVLMTPALYIIAAWLGVAPSARDMLVAAGSTLRDAGIGLLGLAPALLFLVATSSDSRTIMLLGLAAVALCACLALYTFHRRLFGGDRPSPRRAHLVYVIWALVLLGIGWRLLAGSLSVA